MRSRGRKKKRVKKSRRRKKNFRAGSKSKADSLPSQKPYLGFDVPEDLEDPMAYHDVIIKAMLPRIKSKASFLEGHPQEFLSRIFFYMIPDNPDNASKILAWLEFQTPQRQHWIGGREWIREEPFKNNMKGIGAEIWSRPWEDWMCYWKTGYYHPESDETYHKFWDNLLGMWKKMLEEYFIVYEKLRKHYGNKIPRLKKFSHPRIKIYFYRRGGREVPGLEYNREETKDSVIAYLKDKTKKLKRKREKFVKTVLYRICRGFIPSVREKIACEFLGHEPPCGRISGGETKFSFKKRSRRRRKFRAGGGESKEIGDNITCLPTELMDEIIKGAGCLNLTKTNKELVKIRKNWVKIKTLDQDTLEEKIMLFRKNSDEWKEFEKHGLKLDLSGKDLSERDLRGFNLMGANLTEAELMGANLTGANLQRAILIEADLMGANLMGANLQKANLEDADLLEANLTGADFSGAILTTDLRRVNLQGVNLSGTTMISALLQGANLQGANLRGANLHQAYLEDANLEDADLSGVNFGSEVEFKNTNLAGANLTNADFSYAELGTCTSPLVRLLSTDRFGHILRKANLTGANLTGTTLSNVDFSFINLTGATLSNTYSFHASFPDANLTNADLKNATLDYVDLNGANLTGADLKNASLDYVDLENADLTGADLTNATLTGTVLSGATLTGTVLSGVTLTGVDLSGAPY